MSTDLSTAQDAQHDPNTDKSGGKGGDKSCVIVVNGTEHPVPDAVVRFEQVTSLAFPTPPTPDTVFTVSFRKAHDPKEGSLSAGMSVEVKKKGTVFNVKATGKS